jgi:hypothetical protein
MKNLVVAIVTAAITLAVAGCAADKPEVAGDLDLALDVASTLEGAYAAKPSADPKVTAEFARLLATGQAAVAAWAASNSPADQALADAAVSALVAYEASVRTSP